MSSLKCIFNSMMFCLENTPIVFTEKETDSKAQWLEEVRDVVSTYQGPAPIPQHRGRLWN